MRLSLNHFGDANYRLRTHAMDTGTDGEPNAVRQYMTPEQAVAVMMSGCLRRYSMGGQLV